MITLVKQLKQRINDLSAPLLQSKLKGYLVRKNIKSQVEMMKKLS